MKRAAVVSVVALLFSGGCALKSRAVPTASAQACVELLKSNVALDDDTIDIDIDCVIEVRAGNGTTLGRLPLARTADERSRIRGIEATSTLLFVLRDRPGRVDIYALPTLATVPAFAMIPLREPSDLAVREDLSGQTTLYVLDNVHYAGTFASDEPQEGSSIVRMTLDHHVSPRRDVVIARSVDRLATRSVWGDEWRTLEEIQLQDNELRVVVVEDGTRYAEYFTLAGFLLERERLGGSR